MTRHAHQLTDAKVRNAKGQAKAVKITDGGGMYLLVQPNGSRLWRYKFRLNGTEGVLSMGAYPDVSLATARDLHRAARATVAAGQNPVHARKAEREQAEASRLLARDGDFCTVVAAWRAATDPSLAPRSIAQREREIAKRLTPEFKGRSIDTITRAECSRLLKRVEAETPEVARNLRSYLWAIFEHAANTGLVTANPVPPVQIMKPRQATNHQAMSADDVPAFVRAVRASTAEPGTKWAMLLVLLTAVRKGEATGATWSEFDLDGGTWTVPADRMKARRPHWVPLSAQAVALLQEIRQGTPGSLLFPNRRDPRRPMAERSLNALIDRIAPGGDTVHGFRSAFSTMANAAGVNPDVVERCLAHAQRDQVRAAYNRHQYHDERRILMQQWADHIDPRTPRETCPKSPTHTAGSLSPS